MRALTIAAVAAGMFIFLGCASSPQGGPSGSGEGFKIEVPRFGVTVKQGETESAKIKLNRGKHFKQDVKLELKPSKGISVKPTEATVKADEAPELPIMVTAPKDAAIGEYTIHIQGTPEKGRATTIELKVKVKITKN